MHAEGILKCVWSVRPSSPLRLPHLKCCYVMLKGLPEHDSVKGSIVNDSVVNDFWHLNALTRT